MSVGKSFPSRSVCRFCAGNNGSRRCPCRSIKLTLPGRLAHASNGSNPVQLCFLSLQTRTNIGGLLSPIAWNNLGLATKDPGASLYGVMSPSLHQQPPFPAIPSRWTGPGRSPAGSGPAPNVKRLRRSTGPIPATGRHTVRSAIAGPCLR